MAEADVEPAKAAEAAKVHRDRTTDGGLLASTLLPRALETFRRAKGNIIAKKKVPSANLVAPEDTHADTQTHGHTQTNSDTHTRKYTRRQTHKHTDTDTHTRQKMAHTDTQTSDKL